MEALVWLYVMAGCGLPGNIDNDGIKIAVASLEGKIDKNGMVLARKRCDEITAEIKKNKDALHKM